MPLNEYCSLSLNFKDGYKADDGTVVQFHTDWMKSHQIEGDGLLPLLYHHLYRKDKDFKSSPGARIPDTVVYEHNFPRAWYTYEGKNRVGEITKRSGKFLDVHHIFKHFSKQAPYRGNRGKFCDIVAQYSYSRTGDDGIVEMNVEFFTKDTLYQFLHNRRHRPDGVLQKFLIPKGTQNSMIQAVYANRVNRVYKRSAVYRLDDRTKSPYERAVTFDGPSHLSEDTVVSEKVQAEVTEICENFVAHFLATEHKPITRMSLFFKMDEFGDLWIMSCSSLRIGGTKFAPSTLRIPLNLSTKFSTSDVTVIAKAERISGAAFEENLLHRDMKLYSLSHDYLFTKLHCVNDDATSRAQTARAHVSPTRAPPILYNDNILSPRNPFYTVVGNKMDKAQRLITMKGGMGSMGSSINPTPPSTARSLRGTTARYQRKEGNHSEWWLQDAAVRDRYQAILKHETTVLCFLKDTVYDLYSDCLEDTPIAHTNTEKIIEIPLAIRDALEPQELRRFLSALGLEKDTVYDVAKRVTETHDNHTSHGSRGAHAHKEDTKKTPVYQLLCSGENIVREIFDTHKMTLKNEYQLLSMNVDGK